MCDVGGRLVAWMDGELAGDEAAAVEQHVAGCAECRVRVAAYEEVSRGVAAYCDAVMETATAAQVGRRVPRWAPVLAGAAAVVAMLLLGLALRTVKPTTLPPQVATVAPVMPRLAEVVPVVAPKTAPAALKRVHRQHVATHQQTPSANWAMAEPAIQIAIPAEAMFPPGAVPEGVNFIANVSLAADGSVQGLRLRP